MLRLVDMPRTARTRRQPLPRNETPGDLVELLSAERLLEYAETWRTLARSWTRLAERQHPRLADKLRRTAQAALYAANEAEELVKHRDDDVPRRRRPRRST